MALYTEEGVRACIRVRDGKRVFYQGPGDRLTPAAKAWLAREGVEIIGHEQRPPQTYNTLFGATLTEKPEHMTHLQGSTLVFKDHPRIAFRGFIDLLEAEILLAQQAAQRESQDRVVSDLQEILQFVRNFIRCDVLGEPLKEVHLLGLSAAELREHSHYPQKYYDQSHFMPAYTDCSTLLALNKVRTVVRQTELAAYRAWRDADGQVTRPDIILGLNRLSSVFWILMIQVKAGKYNPTTP